MTRDEVIIKGGDVQATKHSMQRRGPWHNYRLPGLYMLTLVVNERAPLLGSLVGSIEEPHVILSDLGQAIYDTEIPKIHHYYPQLIVRKVCIMPDHLHLIIWVKEELPEGKHLGQIISSFKGGCSKAASRMGVTVPCASAQDKHASRMGVTVPCASAQDKHPSEYSGNSNGTIRPLFAPGYNDKILLHDGQIDNWKRYLDDNPRRLMMKRLYPRLFTVCHQLEIAGELCQTVGNRFLLDIPDKMAVIVHRRYTEEENERHCKEWLACGERGGVLVSAAISPKEKEILREARNRGYNIILLRENGFSDLYKPSGEAFDACAAGLLLEISPWPYHMDRQVISREQCLYLNALAEKIAGEKR